MAVQFNTIGEALHRNTAIVAANADYTAMVWWRRTAAQANYRTIISLVSAGGSEYAGIYSLGFGSAIELDVTDGVSFPVSGGPVSTTNNWQHYTYKRSGGGTVHSWYINGYLIGSVTLDISGVTLTDLFLGDDTGGSPTNHEAAYFREWSAALSDANILAEVQATAAVRTANLLTDTPLTADLLDDSGNGTHWSVVGTVGFVADPVIATVPLNTVAQRATALVPGTTQTQDVYHEGVTYTVWYKHANATALDQMIAVGIWGNLGGTSGSNYWPFANVYPDPLREEFVNQMFENGSVTLPVPAGMTLYWEVVRTGGGSVSPSPLSIKSVQPSAIVQPTIGHVFISSASIDSWMLEAGYSGLHGAFIDVLNAPNEFVGFLPQFVTGEYGDILPTSGRMLYGDEFGITPAPPSATIDYWLNLYSPQFELLDQVLITDSPVGTPRIRTHNPSELFYVLVVRTSTSGQAKWYTVDADGALSAPTVFTYTGAGLHTLTVNVAQTKMYLARGPSSTGANSISQMDLGTGTITAFVAAVAGYKPTDMITLSDDSIAVAYLKTSAPRDMFVRRYDAAGATLGTYTPTLDPLSSVDPRLGYSGREPESFLLFNHLADGYADVRYVEVAGMTLVGAASITPDVHRSGVPTNDPDIPTQSDSCPVIELRVGPLEPDEGTIGPLLWVKIRRRIP